MSKADLALILVRDLAKVGPVKLDDTSTCRTATMVLNEFIRRATAVDESGAGDGGSVPT